MKNHYSTSLEYSCTPLASWWHRDLDELHSVIKHAEQDGLCNVMVDSEATAGLLYYALLSTILYSCWYQFCTEWQVEMMLQLPQPFCLFACFLQSLSASTCLAITSLNRGQWYKVFNEAVISRFVKFVQFQILFYCYWSLLYQGLEVLKLLGRLTGAAAKWCHYQNAIE